MQASPTTSGRVSSWVSRRLARGALALLLLTSCKVQLFDDGQPITYVDIVDRTKDDENAPAKLDRKKLEAAIQEAMKALPGFSFRPAKPSEVPWQLDVRIGELTERTAIPEGDEDPKSVEGMKRRGVMLGMRLHALSRVEGRGEFAAQRLHAINVKPEVTFDEVTRRALLGVAKELVFSMKLKDASPEDLIAATKKTEDEHRRLGAIRTIAEKKIATAVPALSTIVRDEDEKEHVVLAAIGALVAIGDPEAVPVLIDAGRSRPATYLTQILFAISALGGRDAKGYLFTVQSGHPDPALREVAAQALEELEAREARAPPEPPTRDGE